MLTCIHFGQPSRKSCQLTLQGYRVCLPQVEIIDGRIITGYFVCLDKQGNLVLQNAVQSFADHSEERQMGMAIVPKQQRTSCHVEVGALKGVAHV